MYYVTEFLDHFIMVFNGIVGGTFAVLFAYQLFFLIVGMLVKRKEYEAKTLHKYAFLVAARNESAVIANLIDSILRQNYPAELIDIYVVADNCTDNTADVARAAGATVYVRHNKEQVGKSYALDFLLHKIRTDFPLAKYDGYFVFDADNLVTKDYVRRMNDVFDNGYDVVTSYRNTKNFRSSWISACYGIYFLREALFLNNARMRLGLNCAISGTGFLVSADIIEEHDGWKYNTLTEDLEFTMSESIRCKKIGYAAEAEFYDEQPITLKESLTQRMRWTKGGYQVFGLYGRSLFKRFIRGGGFTYYDLFISVSPLMLLTVTLIIFDFAMFLGALLSGNPVMLGQVGLFALTSLLKTFIQIYLMMVLYSSCTLIKSWRKINAPARYKLLSAVTFPIFIFTCIPISIKALFVKVQWKPIKHSVATKIDEL